MVRGNGAQGQNYTTQNSLGPIILRGLEQL